MMSAPSQEQQYAGRGAQSYPQSGQHYGSQYNDKHSNQYDQSLYEGAYKDYAAPRDPRRRDDVQRRGAEENPADRAVAERNTSTGKNYRRDRRQGDDDGGDDDDEEGEEDVDDRRRHRGGTSRSNNRDGRDRRYDDRRDREHPHHRDYKDREHRDDHRDRDRDRDRYSRDYRDRDRDRDRDSRDYRSRSSRDRHHDDYTQHRSSRSSRRSSRSPGGGGGSSSHHRRRSPSPEDSTTVDVLPLSQWPRRMSKWDQPPPGFEHLSVAQVKASGMIPSPAQQQGILLHGGTGPSGLGMPAQPLPPGVGGGQTTNLVKQARRIYVGGLPAGIDELELTEFFQRVFSELAEASIPEGNPVTAVSINRDKNFAFMEFRSPEEALIALSFDGVMLREYELKVRRPKDFGPMASKEIISNVPDTPNRIFIGNLPTYLADDQVRELLSAFGELKAFHLVKDLGTGQSKGYAFCEYLNPELTDIACSGLNDMELGEDRLVVQRANEGGVRMFSIIGIHNSSSMLGSFSVNFSDINPSRILLLLNLFGSIDELSRDFNGIKQDIEEECAKFGEILSVIIPRGPPKPDLVKVFVEFSTELEAKTAMDRLSGRKFGERTVVTSFYPEDQFQQINQQQQHQHQEN